MKANKMSEAQWVHDMSNDFTKELEDSEFTLRQMILLSRMQGRIVGIYKAIDELGERLGAWMAKQDQEKKDG